MGLLKSKRWRKERGGGVLRPSRDVLTGVRDGVAVLLDLRREVYLGLDEVGTTIWQEVEQGTPDDEIVERVCAQYDAPRDVIARDAAVFMNSLERQGLVVRG
jgi:hypothetical protein